jgi:hypothetical protein
MSSMSSGPLSTTTKEPPHYWWENTRYGQSD